MFTISEKYKEARYLVFIVDICNLGLVAIRYSHKIRAEIVCFLRNIAGFRE